MKIRRFCIVLFVIFFVFVNSAFALDKIDYYKAFNKTVVYSKMINGKDNILIMTEYVNGALVNANIYNINDKTFKTDAFVFKANSEYKFFVWDSLKNMIPKSNVLTLSKNSPNKSAPSDDGEYTPIY